MERRGAGEEAPGMCTRVLYRQDDRVVVGRSMDWMADVGTNLWAFPRGMARTGRAGEGSMTWTSRFGSVIASAYEICTTDGLNDAGLVANLLWLAESEYSANEEGSGAVAVSVWAQYVLDMFSSVAEAVETLTAAPLVVKTTGVPGENILATVHLSISDRTGDSAIIEYIDGRQVIHHDPSYRVMTNSPTFGKQLAINEYWKQIGGDVMLPGTHRAADRFVRASYYTDAIPPTDDPFIAVAAVLGVIRNVSVPFGIATPGEPNICSTRWSTVADQEDLRYVFESSLSPNTFWVELTKLDLSEDAPPLRLALGDGGRTVYAGDVSDAFEEATPFTFLAASPS
jgi:penicillin V acylase-like amidase (Ntn superfamily)